MTILASAAQVLRCFSADCTELTVTDLVARLGMPKSNASRLLRAMRDVGMLETVGATKRYRPGALLLDVGRAYRRASGLIRRAHEVVGRISSACGHTGYVSVRDGAEITAVTDHPGANHLRVVSNIGRRFPAFASAVGRASLARLSDQEVRQLYAAGLTPPTPKAPQSVDELIERLAVVRRTGVAVSHEEMTPGVIAMAAAVADPETGEEASLCIVFPAVSANESQRDSIARALREGVHEIAAITGDGGSRRPRRTA